MWRINLRILALFLVLVISLMVPDNRHDASAGTYSPCVVPPTVGGGVKPNVLFVMDYSGSMQGPAHYSAGDSFSYYTTSKVIYYSDVTSDTYDPRSDYSGYFEINKYYKYDGTNLYFTESTTKPSGAYTFAVDKIRIYKQVESDQDVYYCQVWTQTSFGSQLAVDDPICFENVSKKDFLMKSSWRISSVDAAAKTLTFPLKPNKTYAEDPIDGTTDSGNVFKRVAGKFQHGATYKEISGNVINYFSASRYDNALKALIGGRADVSSGYATLKPLVARKYMNETSQFLTDVHVYPSTSTTSDYSSGHILTKTTRMNVTSKTMGTIKSTSPPSVYGLCKSTGSSCKCGTTCVAQSGSCGAYYLVERWTFTLTESTAVTVTMAKSSGSTLGTPFLKLYSGATPSGTPDSCYSGGTLSKTLAAGTWSIEATTYDGTYGTSGTYTLTSNVELTLGTHPTANPHNGVRGVEWIGNLTDAWCKLYKPTSQRSGIVQENMGKVRFGFIMFRGSPGDATAGKIMVPLHNTSVDNLVNAFQGSESAYGITYSDTTNGVFPYSGTPTGEAMREAQYYLQQSSSMGSLNSQFNGSGTQVDPYYGQDYSGAYVGVACRKSFVVLISDGIWSSYMSASGVVDPVEPAYTMHHSDLRTGITGDQLADVYSLYVFGEEAAGRNSMKEVAMYGGFTDKDANNWPYPRSGYPAYSTNGGSTEDRSCNLRWPLIQCCKCPSYSEVQASTCSWKSSISACWDASNTGCLASLCPSDFRNTTYRPDPGSTDCGYGDRCACNGYDEGTDGYSNCDEWATKTYENTTHDRSGSKCTFRTLHGVPTNYFQASDAAAIEDALGVVLAKATQQTGSAGSVATVSQKYQGEDLVVRAAFEAADSELIGGYKWYGHLETYLPFQSGGEYKYDFDMPCNANKVFCRDMPGETGTCHSPPTCWDAGEILRGLYESSTGDTDRKLLTATHYYDSAKAKYLTPNWTTSTSTGACSPTPAPTSTWQFENFPKWADISGSTDCKNKWKQLLSSTTTLTDDQTRDLIYWIRGSGVTGLRDRAGNILGDIVYSTPVVVGSAPPIGIVAPEDPDYAKFLVFRQSWVDAQKKSNKPASATTAQKLKKMVYVGANDGMLHAFVLGVWDWDNQVWMYNSGDDPDIGKELWSYMPSNLISQMKCLADTTAGTAYALDSGCNHRYMVDLSPSSFQVYITSSDCQTDVNRDGSYSTGLPCGSGPDYRTDCILAGDPQIAVNDGKCWRTIIIGGERGGGDLFFAIDVTNSDEPKLLWEFSMLKDLVEFKVTSGVNQFRAPVGISSQYDALKILPMAWSRAQVGRLSLPAASTYKFYVSDPDSETLTNWPGSLTTIPDDQKGDRHLVFVGGGFRIFQDTLTAVNGVTLSPGLGRYPTIATPDNNTLTVMGKPRLVAIDVETGKNIFRYLWPSMIAQKESDLSSASPAAFDPPARGSSPTYYVPFAMADPVLQDIWDLYQCERPRAGNGYFPGCQDGTTQTAVRGMDGYVDHIYVGDMNGYFYAVKFRNFRQVPTGTTPSSPVISVDVRPTKGLDETSHTHTPAWGWSRFRSKGTPVTIQPSVSIDIDDENYARVIFGTGKYDDIPQSPDDKSDPAKMALYNLKDPVDPGTAAGSDTLSTGIDLSLNLLGLPTLNTYFDPASRCTYFAGAKYSDSTDTAKCKWAKSCTTDATSGIRSCVGDCCQATTNSACDTTGEICWNCIYDLTKPDSTASPGAPGERITNKALIAGGLVFVTSYVPPSDPCMAGGEGYLYAFSYTCGPFPVDFTPFNQIDSPTSIYGTSSSEFMIGQVVNLGTGVPSSPVLDSSGKKLIIQMSDGKIVTKDVNLLIKHVQVKGWRERPQ